MNSVNPVIASHVDALPRKWHALQEHVSKFIQDGSRITPEGAIEIGHDPATAPEAYLFRLYPPADLAWIEHYAERVGQPIPDWYQEFLSVTNGCYAYGTALYGLPPSMQTETPRLNRLCVQPLDIEAANRFWILEWPSELGEFYCGGREYSGTENSAYLGSDWGIRAVLQDGTVVGTWVDLPSLLADELEAEWQIISHDRST